MSLFKDKIELQIQEAELATQKSLERFPPLLKWLLVGCLVAIIPGYYAAKAISRHIWQNKYQKTQLTAKPSFTNPKAPVVSNITVTTLKQGSYAAVITISNPNFDLSLDQVPYQVIFYNAQKQQIYSYSDQLYLLPNQTKYLTVPTFTANNPVAYTNLQLPQTLPWQKRLQIPTVDLITSPANSSQESSPPAFVVTGDFTNNSPYTLGTVRLTFVLYDSSNNIIGVSQRDEFTVAPFERRSYTQLWPNSYVTDLGKIDVEAYTDTLNQNNLSVPAEASSSASSLSR
jgi:hypothetical protein